MGPSRVRCCSDRTLQGRALVLAPFIACVVLASSLPAAAIPVGTGAWPLFWDPSVTSAAMGHSSAAACWSDAPNAWANPALASRLNGISFHKSQCWLGGTSGAADPITTEHAGVGYGGVGLIEAGSVGLVNGVMAEYGTNTGTDEMGTSTIEFRGHGQADAWGMGIDLVRLLASLDVTDLGSERWGLAVGQSWARFRDDLAPDTIMPDLQGGHASVTTRSRGVLAHGSPLISPSGSIRLPGGFEGVRIDVAAGWSSLHDDDALLVHVDGDQPDPVFRMTTRGFAVRATLGRLAASPEVMPEGWQRVWREALAPLLSTTLTYDHSNASAPDRAGDRIGDEWHTQISGDCVGAELTLANTLSVRTGHTAGPAALASGTTWGWGVGAHLGRFLTVRYDFARVPRASGQPKLEQESWAIAVTGDAFVELLKPWIGRSQTPSRAGR